MGNNQMKQTKFDCAVSSKTMQLIKAVIPYINNPASHYIGTLIKFLELKNAMDYHNSPVCAMDCDKHSTMDDMLDDLMDFMDDDTKESFESFKMMFDMMQNGENFDMSSFMGGMGEDFSFANNNFSDNDGGNEYDDQQMDG